MADLGRRFLEEYGPVHCKPSTQREYRRSIELFIDPAISEMRISLVERKDIAKLHHDLRNKPYQSNRTLGVLSKMFTLAEVWGLRPDRSNPCRHVKRYKENKRERFLSPEETERLGEVLAEAEDEMPSAVAAFRLLLLTGCRLPAIGIPVPALAIRQGRLHRAPRREDRGSARFAARVRGPSRYGGPAPRGPQSPGHHRQTAGIPHH